MSKKFKIFISVIVFCCIFGWYFYVKSGWNMKKKYSVVQLQSFFIVYHHFFGVYPALWKTVRLHGKKLQNATNILFLGDSLMTRLETTQVKKDVFFPIQFSFLSTIFSNVRLWHFLCFSRITKHIEKLLVIHYYIIMNHQKFREINYEKMMISSMRALLIQSYRVNLDAIVVFWANLNYLSQNASIPIGPNSVFMAMKNAWFCDNVNISIHNVFSDS